MYRLYCVLIIWITCFISQLSSLDSPAALEQKHVMIIHIQELTDDQGGDYHVYGQILAYMKLDYKVTYVYLLDYKKDYDRTKIVPLEKMGVIVVDGSPGAQEASTVFKIKYLLMTNKYESVVEFLWGNPDYLTYLRDVNEQISDISPSTIISVLNADIFHERMYKEFVGDISQCSSCKDHQQAEMYFWKHADVIIGVNDDLNVVAKRLMPTAKIVLLPYCELVDSNLPVVPWESRSGVVYFGHDNSANAQSVDWLGKHVSPQLLAKYNTTLNVFGKVRAPTCLPSSGCIYHGPVTADKLNEAIMSAKWMMAPIFTNVGISTKILRALGLGTPVITTKEGTGGMEGITDVLPLVVSAATDYASSAERVYGDHSLWASLQNLTKAFVEKHFSMDRLIQYTKELNLLSSTLRPESKTAAPVSQQLRVLWNVDLDQDSLQLSTIIQALALPLIGTTNIISTDGACPNSKDPINVFVRIQKHSHFSRPSCCRRGSCIFIVYFSWDFGYVPTSITDKANANVDFIWTMTSYNARMLTISGVEPHLVRAVPYGVNCSALLERSSLHRRDLRKELNISSSTTVFAYIGGGLARRAVELIMSSYGMAFRKHHDVILLFFVPSKGSQHSKSIEKLMQKRQRAPMRLLTTSYESSDIFDAIDILIHPVGTEWSLASLEALVAGKIVLSTDKGAMNEYFSRSAFFYPIWAKSNQLPHADVFSMRDEMNRSHHSIAPSKASAVSFSSLHQHIGRKSICEKFEWADMALNMRLEIERAVSIVHKKTSRNLWRIDSDTPPLIVRSSS